MLQKKKKIFKISKLINKNIIIKDDHEKKYELFREGKIILFCKYFAYICKMLPHLLKDLTTPNQTLMCTSHSPHRKVKLPTMSKFV